MSRSRNIPTAGLWPSVRTTSLTNERADIAGAHQLGGDADSFIIANRRNAGSFLAQDVSDLHRNLLQMKPQDVFGDHQIGYTLCPIVNLKSPFCGRARRARKVAVILTFLNILCHWAEGRVAIRQGLQQVRRYYQRSGYRERKKALIPLGMSALLQPSVDRAVRALGGLRRSRPQSCATLENRDREQRGEDIRAPRR